MFHYLKTLLFIVSLYMKNPLQLTFNPLDFDPIQNPGRMLLSHWKLFFGSAIGAKHNNDMVLHLVRPPVHRIMTDKRYELAVNVVNFCSSVVKCEHILKLI